MDVDREQFRKELLPILRNIAKADFVTFDLEMSGISTRPKFSSGDRSHNVGKPTLEQQYQELKSAAEAFQVLQIGITCVEADREKEFYLARPYNFNLTPLSADAAEEKKSGDLRLERVFSFSSSASGFLYGKKFDFGKIFTHGVPYLSRDEEACCREEYNLRANVLAKQPSVQIRLDDQKTLAFYRRARRTIHDWLKSPTPKDPWINIGNPDGPLNPFQRLLVHQLIREEFPTLKCFGKNDGAFMQVEVLDHKKEAKYQAKKLIGHNDKIAKQKGLSFIFEALVGGDLSGIQPEWFASNSSDKAEHQLPYIKAELAQIIATLQKKKHVLVGHNVFTDLGFLYKTFIGNLPATVKNFQAEIHDLFPTVFDTKYLATHDNSSMNPRVNLKDHLAPFRKVHVPLIVLHEQHTAYGASLGKEHEAGFDSWMTAELFVKLSAKLYSTFKTSRSVEAMTQLDCISDTDSTSSSIYGSTLNVRRNMSSERFPSESAHLSVPYEKAMDYYSDDDDDSPDGGALIDLRSATSSPKKTDAHLDALNSGFPRVEPFLPTSFQAQSKTNTRLGSLIDGSAHARSVYGGSVNADLLPGLAMSSQAQINANTYSGSSSTFPGLPIGSRSSCLGTFRSSNFKNGSHSAPSTDYYSTIATDTGASGGAALVNAHDHLGSAIIQAPVPWQVTASKRASLNSGQGTTHFAPIIMQDNLPSSYHARQLNSSAVTVQDNDVEAEAANNEALVQQWIPHYNHPFWRPYANKLRVYAVEGGVCKLA